MMEGQNLDPAASSGASYRLTSALFSVRGDLGPAEHSGEDPTLSLLQHHREGRMVDGVPES